MNLETQVWLRRNWPGVLAVAVLAVVLFANQLWFQPAAKRYSRALKGAIDLGMPLDPNNMPRIMPPRLFARINDNSLPEARALENANSGQLTAEFLGEMSQHLGHRGIVVTASDPAPNTNNDRSIVVRAHVRARGRYPDFVMFLDDLARDERLFAVDRFSMVPNSVGSLDIDMWVSRLVLKGGVKT